MDFILAGAAAGLASLLLNRIALHLGGEAVIVYGVPIIEEIIKVSMALLFKASLIATYLLFGVIEGLYDLFNDGKTTGWKAASVSILGHTLFGYVLVNIWKESGSLLIGIGAAIFLHMLWNALVIKAVSEGGTSGK